MRPPPSDACKNSKTSANRIIHVHSENVKTDDEEERGEDCSPAANGCRDEVKVTTESSSTSSSSIWVVEYRVVELLLLLRGASVEMCTAVTCAAGDPAACCNREIHGGRCGYMRGI